MQLKFTDVLPPNYDTSNDWYFVWHSPQPDATTTGYAWDIEGKPYAKTVPDEARVRGTGYPTMASRLGGLARTNREGTTRWKWVPMAEFAAAMEGTGSATPVSDVLDSYAAHMAELERRNDQLRDRLATACDALNAAHSELGAALNQLQPT